MSAGSEILERTTLPIDVGRPDELMEAAGIDVLLATSKHNVRYLLGGYRFLFFSTMEAIGHSRYLPVVLYPRGRPERAAYIGHGMERYENANLPFWTPTFLPGAAGSLGAAALAADELARIGSTGARIGIEPGFLPTDAHALLRDRLEGARFVDATGVLERLRAVKTPSELTKLKAASERITEAMLATIGWAREGTSKYEIIERLRVEEVQRGLEFDYCLLTLGASHNRAGSSQTWNPGEVMSIDSGGNFEGYIGDLARMGVLGEPDAELEDLLAEVEATQQAAFAAVRAGAPGGAVIAAGDAARRAGPNAACTEFVAHGMGLVSHEAPFLMDHPVGYTGVDADRPLEAGMVLSVETTMEHPRRGYIKLEDTVAVTVDGHDLFGESGRGWNRGGVT
jgi:Xaa-Pro dipeptidase